MKNILKFNLPGRLLLQLVLLGSALYCNAADSGKVFLDRNGDGRYSPGEPGMAGVRVSNGNETVLTGSDGSYKFSSSHAMPWVCVITPDGYRHTGSFWCKAGEKGVFGLKKENLASGDFSMLHGADIQYHVGKLKAYWKTQQKELSSVIRKHNAELLVCVGDLTPTGTDADLAALRDGIKNLPAECRMLYGGHDGQTVKSPDNYIKYFGPLWYSWNFRGVHFIALMSELFIKPEQIEMQWRFFKDDLAALAPDTPVVLLTHIPARIEAKIRQLAPGRKFELILQGHYHEWGVMPTAETTIICSSPWREGDLGAQTHKIRVLHRKNGRWSSETEKVNHYRKVSYSTYAADNTPVKGSWNSHLGANATRYTPAKLTLPLQRRWIFDLKRMQNYHSSPILEDGKIYFSVADGNIHADGSDSISGVVALNAASGKLLWKYARPADFYATPVAAGKRIFAADSMGSVIALNSENGRQLWICRRTFFNSWRYQLAATPLLLSGNTLFINSYDGLRAINASNGRRLWRDTKFSTNPAARLSGSKNAVFVFDQWNIAAYNSANGKVLWKKARKDLKLLTMARERGLGGSVAIDGELFIQSMSTLRKMDFSGKELWATRIDPSFTITATPAVSPDKVVVAGGTSIAACDRKSGRLLWKVATGDPPGSKNKSPEKYYNTSSPAIAGDMVICGTDSGKVLVIDLNTGKILQQLLFESPIKGSVAVGENFVCVIEHSGKLHGFTGSKKQATHNQLEKEPR